jgi:hypothetical protein
MHVAERDGLCVTSKYRVSDLWYQHGGIAVPVLSWRNLHHPRVVKGLRFPCSSTQFLKDISL